MTKDEQIAALTDDSTTVELWAEIWRLREAVKGPDGFATWQEAATDERIRRVKAEAALNFKQQVIEYEQRHAAESESALAAALAERGTVGEHVAYSEGGVLKWMTGRKFESCELYTHPAPAGDVTTLKRYFISEDVTGIYEHCKGDLVKYVDVVAITNPAPVDAGVFLLGVAADAKGSHINVMQRIGDVTHVVYHGRHPLGDTCNTFRAAHPAPAGDVGLPVLVSIDTPIVQKGEPIKFGKRGDNMYFAIGGQSFTLMYEPDSAVAFDYMADMLTLAIGRVATQPQQAVTRLDVMSLIHSQMHRVYASAIDREDVDTKYMTEIEDAIMGIYHGRYIAGYDLRKSENNSAPAVTLPKWIDNLKGCDPTMDNVIQFIEQSITALTPEADNQRRHDEAVAKLMASGRDAAAVREQALEEDPMDIVRTLLVAVDGYHRRTSAFEPSPIANNSPIIIAARRACVERGFTDGGLSPAAVRAKERE